MTIKPVPGTKPCDHPGCLQHVTHPCEGCGVQWGRDNDHLTGSSITHIQFKPDNLQKYKEE